MCSYLMASKMIEYSAHVYSYMLPLKSRKIEDLVGHDNVYNALESRIPAYIIEIYLGQTLLYDGPISNVKPNLRRRIKNNIKKVN